MKTKKLLSLNELANNRRNRFAVVAIDETEFWRDDLKKLAGKIEGVYLVNLKEPTHCCEIAISYPAIFLRNFVPDISKFPNGSEDQKLEDIECDFSDNEIHYFSGYSIMNVKHIYIYGTQEEIEEKERCNPSYC